MANFLKSKSKLLILIYGVIIALVLLFALCFMTNYANVHVYYVIENGKVSFKQNAELAINQTKNTDMFRFFSNVASLDTEKYDVNDYPVYSLVRDYAGSGMRAFVDSGLAQKVYDFQIDMSEYNDQLIIYFCVSIVLFACILIASNQSRKIYYISNLVIGVSAPLAIIVYSIIMLVKNLSLMSTFNDNKTLFKTVAYLQDENITAQDKSYLRANWSKISENTKDVNSLGFIFGIIVIVLVIVYSVFMVIYTIYRYKESSKRRAEVIERAAKAND